jgi:3-methylcrotonyl-CoA carboxylase alpha subunit
LLKSATMFERILIANRGEIACRVIRTCRRLGVQAIAVYSDADARALHVREADSAEYIGPSPPAESYLNIDAVLAAAARTNAQAIHPGYGFLSENADFAEACSDAGVVFIGPSASAMRAAGDKVNARRLMAKARVPVVPGYDGNDGRVEAIQQAVKMLGLPFMVKAAAGGGGRGMRVVREIADLEGALESASREAAAAFGDGRLFIERLIEGGRHIEAQVFGDNNGNVVFLGERDCSVQRRHQKVIEESSSPAVDESLRGQIAETALKAAKAFDYNNAGTVEFLLAPDRSFYFLEVNTRLQVEHPVTEERYGIDLVEWQLRVAAGEPLPDVPPPAGHAIEFRLYAEDPVEGFMPSPGELTHFQVPEGFARVDQGYERGDIVSSQYDSLLAKIVVKGDDRPAALEQAVRALGATIVGGPATNLELLRSIAASDDFRTGDVHVSWLEGKLEKGLATSVPEAALAAALLGDLAATEADPWSSGAWRANGATGTLWYSFSGREYEIRHRRLPEGEFAVRLSADWQRLTTLSKQPEQLDFFLGDVRFAAVIGRVPAGSLVEVEGKSYLVEWRGLARGKKRVGRGPSGSWRELLSPLPGVITELKAVPGDQVRAGQTVAVLEAMKMEHVLKAGADCVVSEVLAEQGQRVEEGALLMTFEEAAS